MSEAVLVQRQHFFVGNDGTDLFAHLGDVVPKDQRTSLNAPQRKLRSLLQHCLVSRTRGPGSTVHARLVAANRKHIVVVPISWT